MERTSVDEKTCKCGWRYSHLIEMKSKAEAMVKACEKTSHPFKAAMMAGARKELANITHHFTE